MIRHHFSQFPFECWKKRKTSFPSVVKKTPQGNRYCHVVVSSWAIKHFDFQKLAGVWLARLINDDVGIYGSCVAEGFSAFQRRSCLFLVRPSHVYIWWDHRWQRSNWYGFWLKISFSVNYRWICRSIIGLVIDLNILRYFSWISGVPWSNFVYISTASYMLCMRGAVMCPTRFRDIESLRTYRAKRVIITEYQRQLNEEYSSKLMQHNYFLEWFVP